MAWGLWHKIKNGLKKAGNWLKNKVVKPVVNNVVKPFKPVITAAASSFNPKLGAIVNTGMSMAEKWVNGEKAVDKQTINDAGHKAIQWSKDKFGQPKMTGGWRID